MNTIQRALYCITLVTLLTAGLSAAKSGGNAKESKKTEAAGVTATVGAITAFDAAARTLSVGGKDFIIDEKCTFIGANNKNDLTIKDFKVGDAVTVTYTSSKGIHTATVIAQTSTGKSKAEKVSSAEKGSEIKKEADGKKGTEKKKEKSKKSSTN